MHRAVAQEILKIAEKEMSEKGAISFKTTELMRNATAGTGRDYTRYLLPDGHTVVFNSGRWKRHFIENI
jgi:hypothetical protein